MIRKPKALRKKIDWPNITYQTRNISAWIILAAATIAYLVPLLQSRIMLPQAYIAATIIVGTIIFVGNKK